MFSHIAQASHLLAALWRKNQLTLGIAAECPQQSGYRGCGVPLPARRSAFDVFNRW